MTRFPFNLFKYLPPRFIPMKELFAHLPLIQLADHGLKEHRYFLQPIGEGALGQGSTVMLELLASPIGGTAKARHEFLLQSIGGSLRLPLLQNGA